MNSNFCNVRGAPSVYLFSEPQYDIFTGCEIKETKNEKNQKLEFVYNNIRTYNEKIQNLTYKRYQDFDYNSKIINLDTEVVYDLFEELQEYNYITNLVIVTDNLESFNKIVFKLDYAEHVFTLFQLKVYDMLYEKIIFYNENTNCYTIKLPFWFCQSPSLALCIEQKYKTQLIAYYTNNINKFYIEAFVCSIENKKIMNHVNTQSMERLINYSKEYTFDLSLNTEFVINFHLPIEEIVFFYFDKESKSIINNVVDEVKLTTRSTIYSCDCEKIYTEEQLTGSNNIIHHNKTIFGMHSISFSLNPVEYQPMGHICVSPYSQLFFFHKIKDECKGKEIEIKLVIFGRQVLRKWTGLDDIDVKHGHTFGFECQV